MGKSINLLIDGNKVIAREGTTILEAAKEAGITIPTLCYNKELIPTGVCRICSVEIERNGVSRVIVSCGYPVEDGLEVKTRSPKIEKIRRTLIEILAPRVAIEGTVSGRIRKLAEEYGANLSRFISKSIAQPTRCVLCGLCVRYCSEVVGVNAIGVVGRGKDRQVVVFPEVSKNCLSCKRCFHVCPTGKIASEADENIFPGSSISDYLSSHGVKIHDLSSIP